MSLQFIARKGRSLNAQKIVEAKGKNKRKFTEGPGQAQVTFWTMAGDRKSVRRPIPTLTENDFPDLDCFQALGIKRYTLDACQGCRMTRMTIASLLVVLVLK
jgi:hypothetical protein